MDQAVINPELHVLILEDTPTDAELMVHELRRAGIALISIRVETREAFIHALKEFRPDIVLSDYKLPDFNGMDALEIVRRDHPQVPMIMVTGALSDIEAVDLIHAGARDYVLKDRLARLATAVQRALSSEQGVRARKMAEKSLRESEAKFRALVESTSDWIWEINEQLVYSYASPQVYDLLGYTAEEMTGKSPFSLMPQDEAVRVSAIFNAIMAAGKPIRLLESAHLHKDGRVVFMETSGTPMFDAEGVLRGYRGINRDITGRKQMEKNLLRSEAKFRTLYESSSDAIMLLDEKGFFDCNQAALQMFGYPTRDDFIDKHPADLSPPTQPGGEDSVSLANERNATAFKNGSNQFEWMHCRLDGSEFPAEVLLTSMVLDGRQVLQGTVRDITERKEAETERLVSAKRLEQSLLQTIAAIAAIVEARDPYTAGHQRRVAALARAIAQKMGLSDDEIYGLYLAATIHDLGKISIPAEILSKPSQLSPLEFELVKTHPQNGYDIIKDAQFPWPLAQIVLQHHERLDGSGYPQHLTGSQILHEAKILAVADVVEAMSSHRPYRPSLGLDAALAEITRQRGVLYDPAVVDSCLKLFSENNYTFPTDATS